MKLDLRKQSAEFAKKYSAMYWKALESALVGKTVKFTGKSWTGKMDWQEFTIQVKSVPSLNPLVSPFPAEIQIMDTKNQIYTVQANTPLEIK